MSLSTLDASKISAAVDAASRSGHTQWIARIVDVDCIDPLHCYAQCGVDDRFLWERQSTGDRFVAWDRVDEIESAGSERFADVEAWGEEVVSRLHWLGAPRRLNAPLFVGGFGFEEDSTVASEWKAFPAARFLLPGTIGEAGAGATRFTCFVRVEPGTEAAWVECELAKRLAEARECSRRAQHPLGAADSFDLESTAFEDWPAGPEYRVRSDRAHRVFSSQVEAALRSIERGELEKTVLARSLRVDFDGRVDLPEFLARLKGQYPSCTLVAMARGHDTFLAATPETLLRIEGDRVTTAALAGSAPRGRTPEEDEELGQFLLTSRKERTEHALVVDALRAALAPCCAPLEISERPGLRRLFGIQHLETQIAGRLDPSPNGPSTSDSETPPDRASRPSILSLVGALHPTPAVGGAPRGSARKWIRRNEGLDRGWYASPVGWIDGEGGGEFCVALRSALVRAGIPREEAHGQFPAAPPDDSNFDRASGPGCESSRESLPETVSRAWLFAGAGIVAGSESDRELEETRVKLRALLAPLTEI